MEPTLTEHDISQSKKRRRAGIWLLPVVAAVLALAGLLHFAPLPPTDNIPVQQGYLISASPSSGLFANNTTIRVVTSEGDVERFEVKSGRDRSAISKIRKEVSENKASEISYAVHSGTLISLTLADGTAIVSQEHVRGQRLFTGWGMLISSVILFAIYLATIMHIKQTREKAENTS